MFVAIPLSLIIDGTVLVAITSTFLFMSTSPHRPSPPTSNVMRKKATNPAMMRLGMVQVFMGFLGAKWNE